MPASILDTALRAAGIPPWTIGIALIALALTTAMLLYGMGVRVLSRVIHTRSEFGRSLLVRTRAPGRFAMLVGALSWSLHLAPVAPRIERLLQHALLVAFIVLVGWTLMTAVDIGTALYLRRHRTDVDDNLHARKLLTQARILRRLLNVAVLVVTAAMALMTVPGVKQLGVSLLAAGGAAGIIVGLALQPVLSNIIAGVQIAFTQPIRIDDAVVVQGEFGHVEEIKSTYVVVRLRDLRRLIVPLKFFLEQPFQNWTLESSELRAEILFLVDQRVPVDQLRSFVEAGVRGQADWDQSLLTIQVNNILEKTMEIRVMAGVHDSAGAANLKAEVREQVIGWLQREHPAALPRSGVEFEAAAAAPASRPGPGDHRVQ